MTDACRAREDLWPTVHTCDDPVACALDHLGPPDGDENAMRDLIDEVRQLVAEPKWARTKLAAEIRKLVDW